MRQLLFGLLILCTGLAHAEKPIAPKQIAGATNLTAEQVVELIITTPELVIIDSRKDKEYAKGHIEGAISLLNTTMSEASLAVLVEEKQTPLLFYCNGERYKRSSNAAKDALKWGYSQVYWFRGGWIEWQKKKLPEAK